MKILVLPHVLNHPVRVREVELAQALSKRHEVILLTENKQPIGISKFQKIKFHFKNLFSSKKKEPHSNLTLITLSKLAFKGFLPRLFDSLQLQRLINNNDFEIIINAAYAPQWHIKKKNNQKYILDIVDDHIEGHKLYDNLNAANIISDFYAREIKKINHLVVVSEKLRESTFKMWNIDSKVIPNGVDFNQFHSPKTLKESILLKEKLNLQNKFIFGYIGGMDQFIDIQVVMDAFHIIQKEYPDTALVWVGDGDHYRNYQKNKLSITQNVHFIGPVPTSQSANYIAMFNVGIIPKTVNLFTTAMMPIKSIEYSAARLAVIASPLSELARLSFPNVVLASLNTHDWVQAMKKQITEPLKWQENWDQIFSPYDWDHIARSFEELF